MEKMPKIKVKPVDEMAKRAVYIEILSRLGVAPHVGAGSEVLFEQLTNHVMNGHEKEILKRAMEWAKFERQLREQNTAMSLVTKGRLPPGASLVPTDEQRHRTLVMSDFTEQMLLEACEASEG